MWLLRSDELESGGGGFVPGERDHYFTERKGAECFYKKVETHPDYRAGEEHLNRVTVTQRVHLFIVLMTLEISI